MSTSAMPMSPETGGATGGLASPVKTAPQVVVEQPGQYQLRDLTAQENMAYWAMWMFVAAVATFIVTSAGTFFIWAQIRLTRMAVREAVASTEASFEANAIARQVADAQLRPYLNPIGLIWHRFVIGGGEFISINIEWKNFGQTPAVDVELIASHVVLDQAVQDGSLFETLESDHPRPFSFPPSHITRSTDLRIPNETVRQVFDDEKVVYVYGCAKYGSLLQPNFQAETKFVWRLWFIGDASKPLDGDNVTEVRWLNEPYYSGTT